MVRHDPVSERGPSPPGGRPVDLSRARERVQIASSLFELKPEEEYLKLWKHVLFGTQTCVRMIEGYTEVGMPGDPLDHLIQLRDRLQKLVDIYSQERHDNE